MDELCGSGRVDPQDPWPSFPWACYALMQTRMRRQQCGGGGEIWVRFHCDELLQQRISMLFPFATGLSAGGKST